jgi:hypothetical protein
MVLAPDWAENVASNPCHPPTNPRRRRAKLTAPHEGPALHVNVRTVAVDVTRASSAGLAR